MDRSDHHAPWLTRFSVEYPRRAIVLILGVTFLFLIPFPQVRTDTDPKNMLPPTSVVRLSNDEVERWFALHKDVIVLGIVNDRGIFNRETLERIAQITGEILTIPGVVVRDVTSLTTVDNILAEEGQLAVRPAVSEIPQTPEGMAALERSLLSNPLFLGRLLSEDGTATAIYIPLERGANGKAVADRIRAVLPKEGEKDRYYLAGDPVARDTFGVQMFYQMAILSPIAGMVMFLLLWRMFRNLPLVFSVMGVAMVSIIWSMGLLIALGYPVHIMSSMSPVFLMAIATDSIHIFNEFSFRFAEGGERRRAALDTMAAVAGPVFYSDVTTAVGFASLATVAIVPVKIFGLAVAFGTLVILLMSFTLIPAVLTLLNPHRAPHPPVGVQHIESLQGSGLARLGEISVRHPKSIAIAGGVLLLAAGVGLSRIEVNNNMVHWFKWNSDVRTADRVMNARLGGTSTAYLVVQGAAEDAMKDPAMLRAIEGLQRELEKDPRVGKTFSVVDYVKRINRVLHSDDPAFDRIPESPAEIGQYLFLFGMSAKPSDLDNVVDYPFQKANLFLQLKSWDAGVMADLLRRTEAYLAGHPLPGGATIRPAGIAYFNLVWSNEVLWGMLESFIAGLVLVFLILIVQTRSFLWGLLTFVPLFFTIALIYGVVGLVGKDFDMPVAVLSTLSLGMAIDFAIHFVGRFQQQYAKEPNLEGALLWTVARPGKGILRNALLFAVAFSVMAAAQLTPYITVGVLIAGIMLLSAAATLIGLPSLILIFQKHLTFPSGKEKVP
ncbi:efflux RND transporter permease subunit [Candidatus Manganitrophus noduliformans]|uniref:MMPL family transporter n=1 Tax=Candidatus Manganitrophus noduliformans TaxID=2606439 RepID=A0A7X6IA41_9BACT|nr:MMPL family transporter [Candidatus Manganitrophus noduliformans]NKE70148.1 MMPL family transporter [Candidatus Manganitrophus noduliformans]